MTVLSLVSVLLSRSGGGEGRYRRQKVDGGRKGGSGEDPRPGPEQDEEEGRPCLSSPQKGQRQRRRKQEPEGREQEAGRGEDDQRGILVKSH